ncbi:hypothetical protein ACFWZ7_14450 [Nocardiopsis alba]|uniref:hypothetical protein n=1 Tax=Nocardiopsis alba TaxID=53437 RepID=UPI00366DE642
MAKKHLKRFKKWMDQPVIPKLDPKLEAEIKAAHQEQVAKIREEMKQVEARRIRYGSSRNDLLYRREMNMLNDQLDYELQRGHYKPE